MGIFLVWISLSDVTKNDWISIQKSFQNAKYGWVFFSIFLGFLSHLLRAYRWNILLHPMGFRPKISNNLMAVFVGYLVNLGIPRAGEISRVLVMKNYEKIPIDKGLSTVFAERIVDVFMLGICVFAGFFCEYDFLMHLFFSKMPKNPLILMGIFLVFALLVFWFFKKIKHSKKGFLFKVRFFLEGFFNGFQSILKMQKKGFFLLHSFLIWGLYLAMFFVMIFAFESTKNLSFSAVLICFIAGTFSYAVTNGGVGAYPLSIQKTLILYGTSKIAGFSLGWLMWSSQTLMLIFLGVLSFVLLPILNKKKPTFAN